ncbi:hypothetical protein ABW21_db0204858 [Orbilia brochopaga]|nr:hypothetical protein ABW21_db0204858 [Drechslerella brochopaga]
MALVAGYHRTKVEWGGKPPAKTALAYHYQQCVIENVAASWSRPYKSSITSKWANAVNTIARSAMQPLSPVFEGADLGLDGVGDFGDSHVNRVKQIATWLETFNLEE